jgi:hypothetical protein
VKNRAEELESSQIRLDYIRSVARVRLVVRIDLPTYYCHSGVVYRGRSRRATPMTGTTGRKWYVDVLCPDEDFEEDVRRKGTFHRTRDETERDQEIKRKAQQNT